MLYKKLKNMTKANWKISKPVKVSIDDVCDWIKKHHHEYSFWNTTEYEIDFETDKLINDLKNYVSERL